MGRHCSSATPPPGHSRGGVSRRLNDLGKLEGGVSSSSQDSLGLSRGTVLPDNLPEASFDPGVKVRVAGSPVGPGLSHSFSPSSKVLVDSPTGKVLPPASKSLSEGLGKWLWLSPVRFHYKSSFHSQLEDVIESGSVGPTLL